MTKVPKYQNVISNYLDGLCSFSSVRNLGSKEIIKNYMIHYIEIYPERQDEVEKILNDLDRLLILEKIKKRKFKYVSIIDGYIKGEKNLDDIYSIGKYNYIINTLDSYSNFYPESKDKIEELKSLLHKSQFKKNISTNIIINNYLNSGYKNFNSLKIIGSKREIIKAFMNYSILFPNRKSEIDYFINNYDLLKLKNHFEITGCKYASLIDKYIEGEDVVKEIRKLGTTREINKKLDTYSKIYPDRKDKVDELKEKIMHIKNINIPDKLLVIDNYLNGESFVYVHILGSKYLLLNYLDRYAKYFPDKQDKIDEIKNNIDDLLKSKYSKDELKIIFESKIHIKPTKQLKILNELLFIDKKNIDSFIAKKNITYLDLKSTRNYFAKLHPNNIEEIELLNDICSKYEKRYATKQTCYINKDAIVTNCKEEEKKQLLILSKLYKSNVAIEVFCSDTGYSIQSIKSICNKYENTYKEAIDEINSRCCVHFKKSIAFFGRQIITMDDFDLLDYYSFTHLKYSDFRDILLDVLPRDIVHSILLKFKKTNGFATTSIYKNEQLRIKTVMNGIVVKVEEKEAIFQYLDDNNIPYDAYKAALKKYVNGKLDLGKQKKKI